MNPSTPSIFARPLFAFFFGIALLIAVATYASRAHADVTINFAGCSSVVASGSAVTCYTGTAPPPATPPPPPSTTPTTPSGPVACAGFAKTVYVDMAWGTTSRDGSTAYPRLYTNDFGGLNATDALVVRLSPPGGVASYDSGSISLSEWSGDGPFTRYAVISTTPCDFSIIPSTYNYKIATNVFYSMSVGGSQVSGVYLMQPGVPYYLNIKNRNQYDQQSCPVGSTCNLSVDFGKPAGT